MPCKLLCVRAACSKWLLTGHTKTWLAYGAKIKASSANVARHLVVKSEPLEPSFSGGYSSNRLAHIRAS